MVRITRAGAFTVGPPEGGGTVIAPVGARGGKSGATLLKIIPSLETNAGAIDDFAVFFAGVMLTLHVTDRAHGLVIEALHMQLLETSAPRIRHDLASDMDGTE